ncbi:MAG: FAD-dependent monooxygenase [Myxococcales bacterium]|nr:FAD-dependent monooxygenase [Myxococcales bacterium]
MTSDPEVLVVGAGPTGLVAAAQLAERGVSVRIIDAAPVRSDKSRALGVQARTLELLDKMGLADRLIDRGQRTIALNFHVEGRQVVHFPLDALDVDHTPFPYLLFVSQVETERVLDDHLARLGVQIDRPVELVELQQDEHGVTATVRRAGRPETIRARYVIGADGAHSAVRHGLGLSFRGDAYDTEFILGDVEASGDLPFDQLHLFAARTGVLIVFPMAEGRIRVMATGFPIDEQAGELTLEELQAQVTRLSGRPDFRLERATWLSRFRLHHRGVDRYRVGRVFLAGDAAHIHSPAGGQGMNTGIQDAYNLAWKLAMVLQGQADEALLDSYHAERHPVGQRLLRFTDRLFSLMSTVNPVAARLRNAVAPLVVPRMLDSRGSRVFRFASQLGIRYRHSPVVAEPEGPADARFRRGPRAGDRAPGAALPDGRFLRRLRGTDWWLLAFCGHGAQAVEPARLRARLRAATSDRPWIQPLVITDGVPPESDGVGDPEGRLHRQYGLGGPGLYLVRPDGHIAFRSAGLGVDALCEYLDGQDGVSASSRVLRALPSAAAQADLARVG